MTGSYCGPLKVIVVGMYQLVPSTKYMVQSQGLRERETLGEILLLKTLLLCLPMCRVFGHVVNDDNV